MKRIALLFLLACTLAGESATAAAERLDVATIDGAAIVGQPRSVGTRITVAPASGRATMVAETGEVLSSTVFTSWIVSLVDNNSNSSEVLVAMRTEDGVAAACSTTSISLSGEFAGRCALFGSLTGTGTWEGRLELREGGAFVFKIRLAGR